MGCALLMRLALEEGLTPRLYGGASTGMPKGLLAGSALGGVAGVGAFYMGQELLLFMASDMLIWTCKIHVS